jgi:hypothetical protein
MVRMLEVMKVVACGSGVELECCWNASFADYVYLEKCP